jgi:hypothetical protein
MLYPPAPSPVVAATPLGRVHRARTAFSVLAWTYVAAVAAQVFLAGVAVFVGPSLIGYHMVFAAFFLLLTPALLVAGSVGHVGRSQQRLALALAGLLVLQGGLIHLAHLTGIALVGAFHPVTALAMAIVAWRLAMESSEYLALGARRRTAVAVAAPTPQASVARHLQPWWRSGEPIPAAASIDAPRGASAV